MQELIIKRHSVFKVKVKLLKGRLDMLYMAMYMAEFLLIMLEVFISVQFCQSTKNLLSKSHPH